MIFLAFSKLILVIRFFSGLLRTIENVSIVESVFSDLPLDDLLAASSFEQLESATLAVGSALKKLRTVPAAAYGPQRGALLLECLSRDVAAQLTKILKQYQLLKSDFTFKTLEN